MTVKKPASAFTRLLGIAWSLWPTLTLSAGLRLVSQGGTIAVMVLAAKAVGSLASGVRVSGPEWATIAALAMLKAICRYGEQLAGHGLAFALLAKMRADAFKKLEALAPAWPDEEVSGEIVARLTADVDLIEVFYAHTIGPAAAYAILTPASIAAAYALGGARAASVLAAGLVASGLVFPILGWRAALGPGALVRGLGAEIQGKVNENLRGSEELAALGARDARLSEIGLLDAKRASAEARMAAISGLKDASVGLSIAAALIGLALTAHGLGLSLAAGAALAALGAASFSPALGLGRAFDDLPSTSAAAKRYFALVDTPPSVRFAQSGEAQAPRPPGKPTPPGIALKAPSLIRNGISFPGPVSRDIEPGSRVCVVGPSGCGKSTLLKLIARFYDPDSGAVFFGDRSARAIPESELRSIVSWLGQEPFFFDASVEDNLRIVVPSAGKSEIEAALDRAGFLPGREDRLSRRVGPRGESLSGGERKRLAAARILLKDSPVVLLDESFSNLDGASRARVRADILEALRGRTIIECSHERGDSEGADLVIRLPVPAMVRRAHAADTRADRRGEPAEAGDERTTMRC